MPNLRSDHFDKPVGEMPDIQDDSTEGTARSLPLLDEPHEPRRYVRLTDRRLIEVVARETKAINWHLLRCSVANWDKTPGDVGFAVYTKRTRDLRRVMASGTIPCSVEELRQVLRPAASDAYTATMRELFGDDFVHGAIVHRIPEDTTVDTDDIDSDPTAEDDGRGCRRRGHHRLPKVSDVAVKTAMFAKRHTLTRNEQWCFVDCTQPLTGSHGGGFSMTMASLDPDDVFAGKTRTCDSDVSQMRNVRAGYAVLPSATKKEVRVSFYAHFITGNVGNASYVDNDADARRPSILTAPSNAAARVKHGASARAQMKRLTMVAQATARLAVLVRRRRLGAQKLTDPASYLPRNTRCVCCASAMRSSTHMGLSSKKRVRRQCRLCGYNVCDGCSSKQEVQRNQGKGFDIVRICENCMERVDDAQYDTIPPDNINIVEPTIEPDAPGADSATTVLARLLRDTLVNASEPELPAVKSVIMHVVDSDDVAPSQTPTSERLTQPFRPRRLTVESSQEEYLLALQSQLQIPDRPLSSCLLAGANGRAYPLAYSDSNAGVPLFPLPDNELTRMGVVSRARLTEVRNLPELELICTLACRELRCATALVTLIGHDVQYVLATNNPAFRDAVGPRDQALCAHTIMGTLPMLVPHATADVRFSRSQLVLRGGLRFYFGFPLFAPDGVTAIGAVCCVDRVPRRVHQAQYETLEKLSQSATRIMASRITNDIELLD